MKPLDLFKRLFIGTVPDGKRSIGEASRVLVHDAGSEHSPDGVSAKQVDVIF